MRIVSGASLQAEKVSELGLDSTAVDLTSAEAIASALRRAAGFLCPCSPSTLIRAVLGPLDGLISNTTDIKIEVEEILDALVAHGDLQEHRDFAAEQTSRPSTFIYAAPPSFVRRKSGGVILFGVTPDRLSCLPSELERRIEYINHVRRLASGPDEDLRATLSENGLFELRMDTWSKTPTTTTAEEKVSHFLRELNLNSATFEIRGLTLLDFNRPTNYYRGRWVIPSNQTGQFVGRRPQAYGADLWCFVDMKNGTPSKFLDLPLRDGGPRGCDDAWHLQAAIDMKQGRAQQYRIRDGAIGLKMKVFDFFSPVPMWAKRRWDAIGEPVASSGCLFSYRFEEKEVEEEIKFIKQKLWMNEISAGAGGAK